MIELYRLLIAALKTISVSSGKVAVIAGSRHSTDKNYPLPGVIVDYEPTTFTHMLEDSTMWSIDPAFSLILHVKESKEDPEREQRALEELLQAVLEKTAAVFTHGFTLNDVVMDYFPYGLDQQAFGCGLLIRAQGYEYSFT